jgi:hypothetical protein
MNGKFKSSLKSFLIELMVYAVMVVAYFFLVLHFLGDWLNHIFEHDRRIYAALALGLIVGQGIVLEVITTALLGFIRPRMDDK